MKQNEPRIQNDIVALGMRQALQSQHDITPQSLVLEIDLQIGSDMRCSPIVVVGELHRLVKDGDPNNVGNQRTVLGSLGLLKVTSVAIGRMTMAAGTRCMNLEVEGRIKDSSSVLKDKRFG